jgi:hypothetical protein
VPQLQDYPAAGRRANNLQERTSQAKAGLNLVRCRIESKMLEAE